jgi:hypothetical protein
MKKPIEKMNTVELADEFNPANAESSVRYDYATMYRLTSRLRELHDLARWIPVSERMPTEEDLNELGFVAIYDGGFIDRAIIKKGVVKVWDYEDKSWADFDASNWELSFTHWKRITPPEDK